MIRRFLGWAALAAVAVGAASCSSDSSGDATRPSAESTPVASAPAETDAPAPTTPAVSDPPATTPVVSDDAQALVDAFTAEQPAIELDPLPARPAAGMQLAVVSCAYPTCQTFADGIQAAADALDWDVEVYTTDITPEAYAATWDRVLQAKPDLIAYMALLPNGLIADQLAAVSSTGIPTVSLGGDDVSGPVSAVYAGDVQLHRSGELMGAAVAADGGAGAHAVFVWDPNTAVIMGPVNDGFTTQVTAAGGTVDVLDTSSAEIGKSVPGQVVSYLQAHPDVNYVAFTVADFAAGVPQALEAAGIEGVKLIGRSPQASDLAAVIDGSQWAQVGEEGSTAGYRAVDGLARLLAGMPIETRPEGWHRIFTAESLANGAEGALDVPGSPDAFLAAWQVA